MYTFSWTLLAYDIQEEFEDTKGVIRRTNNTMTNKKIVI